MVDKSSRLKWEEQVPYVGEIRNAYRILVEKSGEMRQLGRHKHSWENNIKIDLRVI
jgi:hypothetical protein